MKPFGNPTFEGELTEVIQVLDGPRTHNPNDNEITNFKFREYFQARVDSSGEKLAWYQIDARMYEKLTK